MSRFGLIGGFYQSQSPNEDPEECINWYVENVEQNGKSAAALYPTAGLKLFTSIKSPNRSGGLFNIAYPGTNSDGRSFAVGGDTLYEVFSNGTATAIGTVGTDNLPVSITASPLQLAICSAGALYIYTFANSMLQIVPGTSFPSGAVAKVDYSDGFFVATTKNTNTWQVSNPFDGLTWPALATTGVANIFSENIISMIVSHRYVWVFSQKHFQPYVNQGAAIFPYAAIPGALGEVGSIAAASIAEVDNGIFLLGGNDQGGGIVWRNSGYNLIRISNYAVETLIQGFTNRGITISDAQGFGFQDQGHTFYQLTFPSANMTIVYDVATGLWHKRLQFANGVYNRHQANSHTYAFGRHLIGDWNSGNIYTQAVNLSDDAGQSIRRERISPQISNENQYIYHKTLQIDMETGIGPIPPLLDGRGEPREPILNVSWSGDGGHTYCNEKPVPCGQAGKYRRRAILWQLGRDRNRCYKIVATDPVPWRIIEGDLDATGYKPQERYASSIRKVS